jgi:opacity protein-like surface antigen
MRTFTLSVLVICLCSGMALAQNTPDTTDALPQPLAASDSKENQPEKVKKNSLYLMGSIVLPQSPDELKDTWKTGYGGGVGGGYMFTPNMEVIVWLIYNSFSLDVPSGVSASGGTISSFEFIGDLKYIFVSKTQPAKARPYLVVGLGSTAVRLSESNIEGIIVPEAKESAITFNFGAGLEVGLSKTIAAFVEGKYTSISTEVESTSYLPFRGGLKIALY